MQLSSRFCPKLALDSFVGRDSSKHYETFHAKTPSISRTEVFLTGVLYFAVYAFGYIRSSQFHLYV